MSWYWDAIQIYWCCFSQGFYTQEAAECPGILKKLTHLEAERKEVGKGS
jgi:hypothetical protein